VANYTGGVIESVEFGFINIEALRGADKNFDLILNIYDGDIVNGNGNVLATTSVNVQNLVINNVGEPIETSNYTWSGINLSIDSITTSHFFVGVDVTNQYTGGTIDLTKYLIGLASPLPENQPSTNRAWTLDYAAWPAPNNWGYNSDLWVNPCISGVQPTSTVVKKSATAPVKRLAGAPVKRLAGAPVKKLAGAPVKKLAGAPVKKLAGAPVNKFNRFYR